MKKYKFHTSIVLMVVLAVQANAVLSSEGVQCNKLVTEPVIATLDGRKCSFAYAFCTNGVMDDQGQFTGEVLSEEQGIARVVCHADFAQDASACLGDESEEGQYCWNNQGDVFESIKRVNRETGESF